jgi:hypothetical protein
MIFLLVGTPVAVLAGVVDVTVGATAGTETGGLELLSLPHPAVITSTSTAMNHIILSNILE